MTLIQTNNLLFGKSLRFFLICWGLLLLTFSLRVILRKRKPGMTTPEKEGRNYLILDLDGSGTIADIEPKTRALLGTMHDMLFESEKWAEELPGLQLNPDWEIQPVPSSKNTVVRFKVWNKQGEESVDVLFDPYGIMTGKKDEKLWQVSAPGTKTQFVPMEDTRQLRALIAAKLQDVSPVEEAPEGE